MKIISKQDFSAFVNLLIQDDSMDVEGVKAKGSKFVFGPLDSAKELRLDYDVTILPPKKYFLPQYETMMTYDLSHPFHVEGAKFPKKKVIIGVHPYDITGIRQMDSYFLDTDVSTSYLRRRKNTIIIGSDVMNVSEKAFFGCMDTGSVDTGYDLFITDLGDKVMVEIGTHEGEQLLRHAANLHDSSPEDVQKVQAIRNAASEKALRGLKVKPKGWHDLLEKNFESSVWKEMSDKCLACGSCTLVCPTCFCYDVQDDLNLDLSTGERMRTWDGCLLRQFTEVAGGEVFRDDIEDRYRHRFHRKGKYLPDRLGFVACVGCGRCSSQCVPDIADPVNLFNKLSEASQHPIMEKDADPHSVSLEIKTIEESDKHTSLHMPEPATLKRVVKLTEDETLFEITLDSGQPLGHKPGQFIEISLFGTGEAPISVSSAPGGISFDIVVRKAGDVTNKLHTMKEGDKVGIRGPFGNGFDTEDMKGKNIIFIGGGLGIVPMRSLINYVLNNRSDYGNVWILYGCRNPSLVLFKDEVAQWEARDDVVMHKTVDTCTEGESWDGQIGVITTIMPMVTFDPQNTYAVVIGPPIFYKFVNKDLLNMGMPEENIIVSLERRMKCGVGKCGHCQMNGIYVCKDGPVFNYKDLKDVPEAFS
ncbi:MAG: 4Fe-4S dicluster domain-containing protein [Thermoplasmata archaeon]|nr:4Fe-4S dicluster domain-containing protein [Thermoplasmata archaeon]